MKVTPIKTHKITSKDTDLFKILDKYLPKKLKERSIVAVTSKIISICEGRLLRIKGVDKDTLIKRESQYYAPRSISKYDVFYTITQNHLVANAGIDESNGNGYYILWPRNPQRAANDIRGYLKKRFSLMNVGVIITDSKASPLRWGVTGMALSHSGFMALNDYIGKEDIFGRKFEYEKVNVMDSLSACAVFTMGEGNEQQPLAILEDVLQVVFVDRNPTKKELNSLKISLDEDLYAPFLKNVKWKRGKA